MSTVFGYKEIQHSPTVTVTQDGTTWIAVCTYEGNEVSSYTYDAGDPLGTPALTWLSESKRKAALPTTNPERTAALAALREATRADDRFDVLAQLVERWEIVPGSGDTLTRPDLMEPEGVSDEEAERTVWNRANTLLAACCENYLRGRAATVRPDGYGTVSVAVGPELISVTPELTDGEFTGVVIASRNATTTVGHLPELRLWLLAIVDALQSAVEAHS